MTWTHDRATWRLRLSTREPPLLLFFLCVFVFCESEATVCPRRPRLSPSTEQRSAQRESEMQHNRGMHSEVLEEDTRHKQRDLRDAELDKGEKLLHFAHATHIAMNHAVKNEDLQRTVRVFVHARACEGVNASGAHTRQRARAPPVTFRLTTPE